MSLAGVNRERVIVIQYSDGHHKLDALRHPGRGNTDNLVTLALGQPWQLVEREHEDTAFVGNGHDILGIVVIHHHGWQGFGALG